MPLFGGFDPFQMMQHQMRDMENMMDSMMSPFGMGMMMPGFSSNNVGHPQNPRQQMINDSLPENQAYQAPSSSLMPFQPFGFDSQLMAPFGGGLFGGNFMTNMFQQMDGLRSQAAADPNSIVYSESKVVSMAPDSNGQMRVYESSDTLRKHGDVKETRRTVRDPSRGLEEMAIGHHIGQKGHIIEKRRRNGGRIEEDQQFIGIQKNEAHEFDRQWSKATNNVLNGRRQELNDDRLHLPIDYRRGGADRERHASPYARSRDHKKNRGPIIEEAD